jgi:hypothetical protein
MTPARLAANRRNAQKSTGPCTRRGKAQSSMNAVRNGNYSRVYHQLMTGLFYAPPCAVDRTAQAILSPERAAHPLFAEVVEMYRQAEAAVVEEVRREYGL